MEPTDLPNSTAAELIPYEHVALKEIASLLVNHAGDTGHAEIVALRARLLDEAEGNRVQQRAIALAFAHVGH